MARTKKPISGNTVSGMSIADAVGKATKPLQLELDQVKKELGDARAQLQLRAPLISDAAHALGWALKHPDYLPGGKFHGGALGTTVPVLKRLCDAAGVPFHAEKGASEAEQPAQPPPAVQPEEQPEQPQAGGENQAG